MYKIIGTDGKEYGPVTGDQIRLWIRERRIERQTPVFTNDAPEWSFVGLRPEFVASFPVTTPANRPPPLMAPLSALPASTSLATTGLICGALSFMFCCCCGGFPFNLFGLIFSVIALIKIAEQPDRYAGRGRAIIGLVLSILGFLLLLFGIAFGHTDVNVH